MSRYRRFLVPVISTIVYFASKYAQQKITINKISIYRVDFPLEFFIVRYNHPAMQGRWIVKLILSLFVLGLTLVPATSQAQSRSIEGSWRGSGFFKPSSGAREKIRCRVSYNKITNKIFSFSGTCANPAGSIRQSGEMIRATDNRYVGEFHNSEFGISGRIRVIVRGNRQTVILTSSQGSGQLNLSRR